MFSEGLVEALNRGDVRLVNSCSEGAAVTRNPGRGCHEVSQLLSEGVYISSMEQSFEALTGDEVSPGG